MKSVKRLSPMGDIVIVKPMEEDDMTVGSIIIPDMGKDKPLMGEVVAVGPGKHQPSGFFLETTLKAGQIVLIPKFGAQVVTIQEDDYSQTDYYVTPEQKIICVVEKDEEDE